MSMCEFDRKLLAEVRNTLYEIRDELKEIKQMSGTSLTYMVNKNNKQAQIHQDAMRYHLGLMEDANEEE